MALKRIAKVLAGIAPIAASAVSGGLLGPVAAGISKQAGIALGIRVRRAIVRSAEVLS